MSNYPVTETEGINLSFGLTVAKTAKYTQVEELDLSFVFEAVIGRLAVGTAVIKSFSATGTGSYYGTSTNTIKSFSSVGYGGARGYAEVSKFYVSATGHIQPVGNSGLSVIKHFHATGHGLTGSISISDYPVIIPMFECAGTGYIVPVGNASQDFVAFYARSEGHYDRFDKYVLMYVR